MSVSVKTKITSLIFESDITEVEVGNSYKLSAEYLPLDADENIIACGDEVVEIVSKIRGYKSENKISMKTQIESLDITSNNADFITSVDYDIKAVGGIQNLTTKAGESNLTFGQIIPDEQ